MGFPAAAPELAAVLVVVVIAAVGDSAIRTLPGPPTPAPAADRAPTGDELATRAETNNQTHRPYWRIPQTRL
jgi:hypothetical protein